MDRRLNHKQRTQTGLTLIELLIVMLIIALTASVVALNAPPPAGKARVAADRLAARIQFASEQAVMTNALIGLELTPARYRFFHYERGEWLPVNAGRLRDGSFPADVAIVFELPESTRRNEPPEKGDAVESIPSPNVFFSPTGETTSVAVDFRARRSHVSLLLDHAGGLKVVRHDDRT